MINIIYLISKETVLAIPSLITNSSVSKAIVLSIGTLDDNTYSPDCDLWDSDQYIISLLGHSAFIESDARVLVLFILCIACFI